MELHLVSVDDLMNTLTRIASLSENASYTLRHGDKLDTVSRFEQIRDEALEAHLRAERGKDF